MQYEGIFEYHCKYDVIYMCVCKCVSVCVCVCGGCVSLNYEQ